MSTVYICAGCGRDIERYEDDAAYQEVESGLCSSCGDSEPAFDRGFAEYEAAQEPEGPWASDSRSTA